MYYNHYNLYSPQVITVSSLCVNIQQLEQAPLVRDEGRRATWLETRNLEENFKELVYLSMQEVR